jgi:aminoglycoside phosphotransferase (APT) family kinase protein
MGLPDWRPPSLAAMAERAVARTADQLDGETLAKVAMLIAELDARFAAVEGCGVPDSLVHGDFHPGNVRGGDDRLVLLDWGDCGVGHPLLDQAAFVERLSRADRTEVQSLWADLWRDAVPGSEPEEAARLLEPVAALRQAVIYDMFLAAIEPSERVYHAPDPAAWLRRAAEISARP